jgi:branched-chain amino acid transport system substrate-binding protein
VAAESGEEVAPEALWRVSLKGTQMTLRSALVAAGCIAVAASVLAACSSSSSAKSGAPSAPQRTLKIGLMGEFSGTFSSSYGALPEVLNAWAASENASGGLGGAKIDILVEDTSVGPSPGLGDAHQLIDQDHVQTIVDFDGSPDDATWLPYAKSKSVPVIVSNPVGIGGIGDALAFPVVPPGIIFVNALIGETSTLGGKLGFVYCSESPSCGAGQALLTGLGYKAAVNAAVSSSSPDFTAQCQALITAHVSAWVLNFGASVDQKVTDSCRTSGLTAPQILGSVTSAQAKDQAYWGDTVIDNVTPYFDTANPAVETYRNALAKYASSVPNSSLDNAYDLYVWAAGKLISAAVGHTSTTPSSATILDGLYRLHGETLGGLTQPLTYTRGQPTVLPCWFTWNVGNGGKFEVANDGKPTCAPSAQVSKLIQLISKK